MPYEHESVRKYVEAKQRGDTDATDRIVREVGERFETRTTDGGEMAELYRASMEVPLGHPE